MPASRPSSDVPDSHRVAAVFLAVLASTVLLTAALAPPVAAAPPPADTCSVCGDDFEDAAAAAGGDVTVASSSMDIYVASNGSTRVQVAVDVGDSDADWVAANADAVVDELAASAGSSELAPVPADATIRTADDVVTVSYDAPGFAHTSAGGVVVVDAFADGRTTGWEVNGDQLRLHAPEGYGGTHGPASTPVTAWTLDEHIDDEYLVYAPDGGLASLAATQAALVVEAGPAFLQYAAIVLAPTLVVLAGLLWSTRTLAAHVPTVGAARAGTVVAAAGGLAAGALVATGAVSTYFEFPIAAALFVAVTAVAVGALAASGRLRTVRGLAAAAVGVPVALGALGAVTGALTHPGVALSTVRKAVISGSLVAQLGAFVVLGASHEVAPASRWRRLAAVLVPPLVVVAVVGPTVLLVAWLPLLVVFAHPAYWLGASLAPGLRSV